MNFFLNILVLGFHLNSNWNSKDGRDRAARASRSFLRSLCFSWGGQGVLDSVFQLKLQLEGPQNPASSVVGIWFYSSFLVLHGCERWKGIAEYTGPPKKIFISRNADHTLIFKTPTKPIPKKLSKIKSSCPYLVRKYIEMHPRPHPCLWHGDGGSRRAPQVMSIRLRRKGGPVTNKLRWIIQSRDSFLQGKPQTLSYSML